jgi:hypothetical protein
MAGCEGREENVHHGIVGQWMTARQLVDHWERNDIRFKFSKTIRKVLPMSEGVGVGMGIVNSHIVL